MLDRRMVAYLDRRIAGRSKAVKIIKRRMT
jgi:hypothetical protein